MPGGPIIFEIPLQQPKKFDVMVVWDEWDGVRSEDRTRIINDAYKDKATAIALALGVTRGEAIEQGILPYRVVTLALASHFIGKDQELREAALSIGGFAKPDGSIDLRFPTQTIAEEAVRQLQQRVPGSQWVITYADV